jgi:hypothetical protein
LHVEGPGYAHDAFRPWRVLALAFKALRRLRPDYELWRDFPYEYEHNRLAIDLINGSELLATLGRRRRCDTGRPGGAGRAGRIRMARRRRTAAVVSMSERDASDAPSAG